MFLRKTGVAGALALVFGTPLYCSSSYAQDPVSSGYAISGQSLDPILVTATRFEQSLSDVIPSVTYISREEIDRSGAKSLAELIYAEPGVEYGRNGGLGTVTSFFLRGDESRNSLVLVDGQRLRDGITQSSLAEHIPIGLIESIEIIRGNVSALYGDGAVGGVVLVNTRKNSTKPVYFGAVSYGSRATKDIYTGFSTGKRELGISVGVQHLSTNGFSATTPSQTTSTEPSDSDLDKYSMGAAHVRIHGIGPSFDYGLSFLGSRSKTMYDYEFNNFNPVSNPTQDAELETFSIFFGYKVSDILKIKVEHGYSHIDLRYNFGTSNKTRSILNRIENLLKIDEKQSLIYSIERREDRRSPASSGLDERNIDSHIVGYLLSYRRVSMQASIRKDDSSLDERRNTWFYGIGYQVSNTLRLTANTSTAFRFPTASEVSQNPNLIPEYHRSKEIGISFVDRYLISKLVIFSTNTKNPITFTNPGFLPVNSNFRENYGAEFEGRYYRNNHRLKLSTTIQNPTSPYYEGSAQQPKVQSARRAKLFGTFSYGYLVDGTEMGFEIIGATKRRDTNYDDIGEYKLGGYSILNLRLSRSLNKYWSFFSRLDNALNKDYQLAYGYNSPPRGLFVGVRYEDK